MTMCKVGQAQEESTNETKYIPDPTSSSSTNKSTVQCDNNHLPPIRAAKRKSESAQGDKNPGLDRDSTSSASVKPREEYETTTKQSRLDTDSDGRTRSFPSSSSLSSSATNKQGFSLPLFHPLTEATNNRENISSSPHSSHTPNSNESLVEDMDLDTHISSPSTVCLDTDVASLSDTLDPSILEEDALVRRIHDLSSSLPLQDQPQKNTLVDIESTHQHQQLLESARAGKKIERTTEQERTPGPTLPYELLIKVFEHLYGRQADLWSAALVCVDWNICATEQLYRYTEFADTINWALFVQTLCKNKEERTKRPTTRRRPYIIQTMSRSQQFDPFPHRQLAPAQIEAYKQDRLERSFGEYVRGIDLSRKANSANRQCSCGRPFGPPNIMKECRFCSHSKKTATTSKTAADLNPEGDGDDDDEVDGDEVDSNAHYFYATQNASTGHHTGTSHASGSGGSGTAAAIPEQSGSSSSGSLQAQILMELGDVNNEWTIWMQSAEGRRRRLMLENQRLLGDRDLPRPTTTSSSRRNQPRPRPATLGQSVVDRTGPTITNEDDLPQASTRRSNRTDSNDTDGTNGNRRPSTDSDKETIPTRKPMTITVSSLIRMARHVPNLEQLCLASTALINDTLYLETGDYMSTLQPGPRAGLTDVKVTSMEALKALGEYCPKLGRLWLDACDWVTLTEVQAVGRCCRRLQMLDVRNCTRVGGRYGRLYLIVEGEGPLYRHYEGDRGEDEREEEKKASRERVAVPLEFETSPTTLLLGANTAGQGVRDGAMSDLVDWLLCSKKAADPPDGSSAGQATTSWAPKAIQTALALLSARGLSREPPADAVAFRKWLRALADLHLVFYETLQDDAFDGGGVEDDDGEDGESSDGSSDSDGDGGEDLADLDD
ncbi:hypothetical protein BGX33_003386 [Mortierella sp. NVP41]|nr:hypothetical protein BGX33_003386 [Mortierella sp. NVP41]